MGIAGHRKLPINAVDAASAAKWLLSVAIPAAERPPATILGGGNDRHVSVLHSLALALTRKAARKRASVAFSALISIEQAAAFNSAVEAAHWHAGRRSFLAIPMRYREAVEALSAAMVDGGKPKRRGRRWLSAPDLAAIVNGDVQREARHKMRLAARQKKDTAWEAAEETWFSEVKAKGETVLTTSVPRHTVTHPQTKKI